MANFIFNEGAALAAQGGLDWVNTDYDLAVFDNTVSPQRDSVWADIAAGAVNAVPLQDKAITSFGACAASAVKFDDISPSQPDGYFVGFVIKRNSDNLLIACITEGFDGVSVGGTPIQGLSALMGIQASSLTYTFALTPGANNENSWFRL